MKKYHLLNFGRVKYSKLHKGSILFLYFIKFHVCPRYGLQTADLISANALRMDSFVLQVVLRLIIVFPLTFLLFGILQNVMLKRAGNCTDYMPR